MSQKKKLLKKFLSNPVLLRYSDIQALLSHSSKSYSYPISIMKKTVHCFLTFGRKRYPYSLRKIDSHETRVVCKAANISQPFLNKDIPALIRDLPGLILDEKSFQKNRSAIIRFRVAPDDKRAIEKKALRHGYTSISGYLRALALA